MITLQLQPEVEAKLLHQARAHGLEVDQYVTSLVRDIDEEEQGFRVGAWCPPECVPQADQEA